LPPRLALRDEIHGDHKRFSTEPLRIFFDTSEVKVKVCLRVTIVIVDNIEAPSQQFVFEFFSLGGSKAKLESQTSLSVRLKVSHVH
jgi:hypothetical protein